MKRSVFPFGVCDGFVGPAHRPDQFKDSAVLIALILVHWHGMLRAGALGYGLRAGRPMGPFYAA